MIKSINFRMDIEESVYRDAKILVLRRGTTLRELMAQALTDYMEKIYAEDKN